MRLLIAHSDPAHPNARPFAFRLGRISEDVDVVTGEVRRSVDQLVSELRAVAEREFPAAEGYVHTLERYVDHGDHTGHFEAAQPVAEVAPVAPAATEPVPVPVVPDAAPKGV